MLIDQPASEIGVARQARIQDVLVLTVDVAIFASQHIRELPITFTLSVQHRTQIECPAAIASRGERGVKRGMRGYPSVVDACGAVRSDDRNAMQAMIRRDNGGLPLDRKSVV